MKNNHCVLVPNEIACLSTSSVATRQAEIKANLSLACYFSQSGSSRWSSQAEAWAICQGEVMAFPNFSSCTTHWHWHCFFHHHLFFLSSATSTVDHAHTYLSSLLEAPPVILDMVINSIFNNQFNIGARARQGSVSEDMSCVLECMFSMQPQPAAPMGPWHGVINLMLMSTFQILSHPLLTPPASRMATRRPMAFRTTCILASLLPFCSALSDVTYNTINTIMVINSALGKHKNTSKGTTALKQHNLGSDANA